MIGYGLAFVIGWFLGFIGRVCRKEAVLPWSAAPIAWGLVFMSLNWIAGW